MNDIWGSYWAAHVLEWLWCLVLWMILVPIGVYKVWKGRKK